jgi:excisionase family DNA binding protein
MADREPTKNPERPISTVLTTGEVARILGVHASTVRRWSDLGKIKSSRSGPRGARRFRREDVAVFYLDRAIQRLVRGR